MAEPQAENVAHDAPASRVVTDAYIDERITWAKAACEIVHNELKAGRLGANVDDKYKIEFVLHDWSKLTDAQSEEVVRGFIAKYIRGEIRLRVGFLGSCWCDYEWTDNKLERIGLDPTLREGPAGKLGTYHISLLGDPAY